MRRRTEAWGDDPSERDADATIAELSPEELARQRRWHDHRIVFPLKVVARFLARNGKRIGIAVVGGFLVVAGIALLVLPGPGWLVIFLGLGILATEFVWAERLLNKAKEKAQQAKSKVLERKALGTSRKADRRISDVAGGDGHGAPPSSPETDAPTAAEDDVETA
jgi:uncharacterized protein (TIGR02611 family)